jgi:hypothetical protein
LALCRGYAPFTRIEREFDEQAAAAEEESPA